MNDFPEKRRSKKLRVSNEENMTNMIIHREVEKQRRQETASLYASLRSLLPLQFIQGKHSTSDQVTGAVNYIEYLQRNIKDMSAKRDMLLPGGNFKSNELGCLIRC